MSIPLTAPEKQSSMIALIGTKDNDLIIKFNKGDVYKYHNAAEHCAAMLTAESSGKYFLHNIKPNYNFEKIS